MAVLETWEPGSAYAKIGFLGFPGSGKTYTASQLGIGLAKKIGADRVAFIDTETGLDHVARFFVEAGITLQVSRNRTMRNAIEVFEECEKSGIPICILDTASHLWQEHLEEYQRAKRRSRLEIHDWGPIKRTWRPFTDKYLTAAVHIILCGRAAWDIRTEKDDQGKLQIYQDGVKMRAETELGYEPSLLVEMERVKTEDRHGFIRRAHVWKDRSTTLDGQTFDNPTFADFEPFINSLNLGGSHKPLDTTPANGTFDEEGRDTWKRNVERRDVCFEKITAAVNQYLGGSTGKVGKVAVPALTELIFGTTSGLELKKYDPTLLERGTELFVWCARAIEEGEVDPKTVNQKWVETQGQAREEWLAKVEEEKAKENEAPF